MARHRDNINQAAILGFLTSINVLLTFSYQWYIVTVLGPGAETDSFFASMVIPQLFLSVVTGSLMFVLVPILATDIGDSFHQEVWNFFIATGALFAVITVILFMSSHYWVPLTVPGFSDNSKRLTITLTQIQLVSMIFAALTGVLSSAYNAKQKFVWASLSQVLSAIVGLVLLVYLLKRVGVVAAAWATTFRMFFQMALLLPILGVVRKPQLKSPSFVKAWAKLKPLFWGNSYTKTDQLVDRVLASMAPVGELSLLHMSQQIYGAVNQVINSAIAGPMVPLLAQNASKGSWMEFRRISKKRLHVVTAISITVFIVIVCIGLPILKYTFSYGRFSEVEIIKLWWILIALVGVLVGGAMGQILSTSFYSKGDTITPTRVGVLGFTVGVLLKFVGYWSYGVIGVAIGTTVYYLINVMMLQFALSRNTK